MKQTPLVTLRTTRVAHNLTQRQVAQMLHISERQYGQKELGTVSFTLPQALKLSRIFKLPVEFLFQQQDN